MIPAVAAIMVVVVVAWRLHATLRSVERLVVALGRQLVESRRAQEHQGAELHRRLGGIEAAAGRAEREARAVSGQLARTGTGQPGDHDGARTGRGAADGPPPG